MSPTDASTSRGTAMSMMNSGSRRCRPVPASTCARVMIGRCDPVAVTTMSATATPCARSSQGTLRPLTEAASVSACAGVRLVTRISPTPLALQVLGRQRADLAGANDEHAPAIELPEDLSRECDGGEADGHGAFAESCFRPHAFADQEGPVKQLAQHRPGAVMFRGSLKGVLHLSEDLRLADDDRVETGGHSEQMTDSGLVVVREQMRREHRLRQVVVVAQESCRLLRALARGRR